MIFQLNYRPRQLTFPLDRLCSITIYVKIQWQRHPLVGSSWNKNILKVMIMYKKATSFLIGGVAMLHCFKIHVVKKCRNFQRLMLDKLICFGGKQKWKCLFKRPRALRLWPLLSLTNLIFSRLIFSLFSNS